MSERGIEIHNGEVVFPEGMPQTLHMGTEASPLTQGEASQIVLSAVINAIALGGSVEAAIFIAIASINLTGILTGLRAETIVNDGVTVTPTGGLHTDSVFGAVITTEILGTGIIGGRWEGLRINISSEAGSESQSALQGIFISGYNLGTQSVNSYHMLRMQENGSYQIHAMFYLRGGTGGVNYFAILHGNHDAWNALGAPATQSGWIKCDVGGLDRWIRLYSVAP
jgi:hypothetical protein